MTGSIALDVVIGLVFIYLLYSLLASVIQEIIATNFSFRAKILEKAILRMLEDEKASTAFSDRLKTWIHLLLPTKIRGEDLSKTFYDHPLIKYLGEDKWNSLPAYITANNFSKVLIDILRGDNVKPGDDIRSHIEQWLEFDNDQVDLSKMGSTKKYLRSLWLDAQGDIEVFKKSMEDWFDNMMEHASSWYKQYNQVFLLIIGLFIAVFFNVDTILITKKLSNDPELRAQIIQQADQFRKDHPNLLEEYELAKKEIEENTTLDSISRVQEAKNTKKEYEERIARRDTLMNRAQSLIENEIASVSDVIGLGWSDPCEGKKKNERCKLNCGFVPNGSNHWALRIVGWLLTALAISLGAPFWFDLLNKLMKLRGAVQSSSGKSSGSNQVSTAAGPSDSTVKRVG
uniref:hypothetical protein n=1 Tax=Fulvivirga sp. TaxID=1931237 RepID=UPI00404AA58B